MSDDAGQGDAPTSSDLAQAARFYVCGEVAAVLRHVIEHEATPEQLPGLHRAVELVGEYRTGQRRA